jgi:hypothetical protein
MAVAIGETRDAGVRRLWLFRNKYRSLWLADLRKTLGQVFFFSVPQIWRDAIENCPEISPYVTGGVKLIELPTEEIWCLTISPEIAITKRNALKRFEVCSSGSYSALQENQIATLPSVRNERIELVTGLEEDDNLIVTEEEKNRTAIGFHGCNRSVTPPHPDLPFSPSVLTPHKESRSMTYPVSPEDIDPESIEKLCDSVKSLAEDIQTVVTNAIVAGSFTVTDFQELKNQLEQTELDLTGTLQIVKR